MTEDRKKTAKAYKTVNEDAEKVSEEMISEAEGTAKEMDESEKQKAIDVAEEKDKEETGKERRDKKRREEVKVDASWEPKTKLGRDVKDAKITNIDTILDKNQKILEEQIVDLLIDVETDLIAIGQSKGKFGGGKRRAWRQTQRKTKEGNVPVFSAMAVVGDKQGHIGIAVGRAKETLPARDKAIRKAKLNVFNVKRGCSAFDCACSEKHTIPFEVEGKSGSVRVKLIPAPQGTGLVAGDNIKPILKLAGIEDVYSKTFGKQRTTFNLVKACVDALKKTNKK